MSTHISNPVEAGIAHCIEALLTEYMDHPLRHLREIGQQTRLHALLRDRFPGELPVEIGDGAARSNPFPAAGHVARVQLELKIREEGASRAGERSDLVVLREGRPVRLARYPNGALDIVAHAVAGDVSAAIEIKAACSGDRGQRHLFRLDVEKLLRLSHSSDISRHFVLVDKSLELHGHAGNGKNGPREWHDEGRPSFVLTDEPDPAPARPFVHVWDLTAAEAPGRFRVRRRYATRSAPSSS